MNRKTHLVLALSLWTLAAGPVRGQQGPDQQEGEKLPREVKITEIPDVIAADAKWQQVWEGTDNADGIVGTSDGGLLFAQEPSNTVRKLDKNDKVSVYVEETHGAGALALDSKNRLYALQRTCTDPGREKVPCSEATSIAIILPEEDRKMITDNVNGRPLGRLNDLVIDKKGSVYFTVGPAYYITAADKSKWKLVGKGKPQGQVTSLGEDLRANGIMLSPDERILYVTNGSTIQQFDIQLNGYVNNRRLFAKLQGGVSGDGMAIDALGRLYVTAGPGVQIFDPLGKYVGTIPTPRNVTSIAFSGREKKSLYVVGSGALGPDGHEFATSPGVRNNAKTIYKIPMLAEGFKGRAK